MFPFFLIMKMFYEKLSDFFLQIWNLFGLVKSKKCFVSGGDLHCWGDDTLERKKLDIIWGWHLLTFYTFLLKILLTFYTVLLKIVRTFYTLLLKSDNQFVKYDPFDFSPQLFLDNNDLNAGLYEGEVKRKWNKTKVALFN